MTAYRPVLFCILFVLTIPVVSCGTKGEGIVPHAVVVSVRDPYYEVRESASFAWLPAAIRYHEDEVFGGFPMNEVFQRAIEDHLTTKGLVHTPDHMGSDLLIGYTLALEGGVSDQEINSMYGINPGLVAGSVDTGRYEKGTIVIDIVGSATRMSVWRGSIHGIVDFELPEEERREGIRRAVDKLLDDFER